MRTNRRVFKFCLVIFAPMLTSVDLGAALSAPPKPAPAKKQAAPNIGITTLGSTATLPDPKRPGKLLYELHWKAGSAQGGDTGGYGTLTTVWAKLFQNGVASAILTAPLAQVSNLTRSVVVTGRNGVVVKSQTQIGTMLTADTVVWNAGSNQIIATGHVVYYDSKTRLTLTGPRMVFDTRLKSYHTGRGQGTLPG